uniref:Uncharacterized protein n=1 Tax=Photinus pyralis TaxID=7054 RepID=A0A1Y1K2U1_PHOPY
MYVKNYCKNHHSLMSLAFTLILDTGSIVTLMTVPLLQRSTMLKWGHGEGWWCGFQLPEPDRLSNRPVQQFRDSQAPKPWAAFHPQRILHCYANKLWRSSLNISVSCRLSENVSVSRRIPIPKSRFRGPLFP